MKIKKGFELHEVCGEQVIIATGTDNIDFSSLIALNETAASLWTAFVDKDFSIEDMVESLCKEYDVSPETARSDSEMTVRTWTELGLIE